MDNLIKVGTVGKPHGIRGYNILHLSKELDWDNLKSVFLEINQNHIPYLIEDVQFLPGKLIIKLKHISSVEEAKKITNKNIFVQKEFILEYNENLWLDYTVMDVGKNIVIGKITDWLSNKNMKWIIVTSPQNTEILLPFNEELIENIDEVNKIIYYKATEGMY